MQDNLVRRPTTIAVRLVFCVVVSCLTAQTAFPQEPTTSTADEISVNIGPGGIHRFVTNRWGVARALVFNPAETPTSHLIVVTPQGSQGLQYARQIEVPARVVFDAIWPVRIGNIETKGISEFQYLHFPGGVDDGVIRRQRNDGQLPTFSGITRSGPTGLSGWIATTRKVNGADDGVQHMLRAMRYSKIGDPNIVAFPARELSERSECLDPLDNLAVSDPQLDEHPQACEAIRTWVQRGGRLLIVLESTGSNVANMLLGDCLPLTVVGETSTNSVKLDLNPDYQTSQYPQRTVLREFDEPVRYLRVIPGAGETIWSVDGWPAAIRVPLGSGCVIVTTISPDVFVEQRYMDPKAEKTDETPLYAMIPSSRRMEESLFSPRVAPLISESVAAEQAAAMIGYEIPSRRVALLFLMVFPLTLIVVGITLQRRAGGERLIWVLPAIAVLTAIPSVAFGLRVRAVAPATIVETSVIQSSPGQSQLASDGYATIYVPAPMDLAVSSETGSRLDIPADATERDYKRLIWRGPTESGWQNLNQPTGLRTFPVQAIRDKQKFWQAAATFDEKGIRGQLLFDDPSAAADVLLVGTGTDRMSLALDSEGRFQGTAADVLPPGQFVKSALVSDKQRYRAALLESVFANTDRLEPFPVVPSLLFWDERQEPALQIADPSARRIQSVLVVQALDLQPPEVGRKVTIPSPLLPYRSIATAEGGFSSAFNNSQRKWLPQESAGVILLQFQIPSVCVPLQVEVAEMQLLIRAASRVVTVESGLRDNLQRVDQMKSPLGTKSISIPVKMVRESCLSGRLFVQISVSDLDVSMKSESMSGEQDDSWKIERVSLTLKGSRQAGEKLPVTDQK